MENNSTKKICKKDLSQKKNESNEGNEANKWKTSRFWMFFFLSVVLNNEYRDV